MVDKQRKTVVVIAVATPNDSKHREEGTQEVLRVGRRTPEDVEGKGNSGPSGILSTWCSDPPS